VFRVRVEHGRFGELQRVKGQPKCELALV
jgi:hypothetical protein